VSCGPAGQYPQKPATTYMCSPEGRQRLYHPPFSTDLSSNNIHFWGSTKHHFKGKHLWFYDEMKAEAHW